LYDVSSSVDLSDSTLKASVRQICNDEHAPVTNVRSYKYILLPKGFVQHNNLYNYKKFRPKKWSI